MTPTLRPLSPGEPANWPESLLAPATFTALDSWSELARSAYRFPVQRFETEIEGQVTGLLALSEVEHPIFGHSLTTAPFGSYGGLAYADTASRDLLLEAARNLALERKVEFLNLRFLIDDPTPPPGWVQQPIYNTYLVDLCPGPEALLAEYSSDHRNHIRKSLKKGLTVQFGGLELLDEAYEALARSMHELGSPYHAKAYLRKMVELLGETLELAVLRAADGNLAGAGVFIQQGRAVTNLHANLLRAYRPLYAGEFLYWQALSRYAQRGFKTFDLGRSLEGSGNEAFKMKWKPRRQRLAYWYWLAPGVELPALNQKNPKFQLAIALWKRLPAALVRPLGPFLIKGLA